MSELHDPDGDSPGRMKAILVVTAAVAFAVTPFVAPFSGYDQNLFPVPYALPSIQPAGYAFAIWGVIYLWLLALALYGLGARADDPAWDAPRWPLIVSLVLGAPWTAVAGFSPVWSVILIFAMLASALAALFATPLGRDRWLLRAPLALYAGWLSVASFVGLSVVANGYGLWPGTTLWAWGGLIAAAALAVWVQQRLQGTPEYAVAVGWGLMGVAVANLGQAFGLVVLAILGCLAVVTPFLRHRAAT